LPRSRSLAAANIGLDGGESVNVDHRAADTWPYRPLSSQAGSSNRKAKGPRLAIVGAVIGGFIFNATALAPQPVI
jgi:hypothetical protein